MANELAVRQGNAVAVPDEVINEYLESLGNKLTPKHRSQFVQICKAFNLNPFIREIYGVAYGDNFNIIVGYEVYIKRAERSGVLTGWKVWTEMDGDEIKGCVEIHRSDWTQPFYHEVYFSEYDQKNSMWKTKGRTMIKKVAIAQGFRMCFSVELGGMPYTADELPGPNEQPQQQKIANNRASTVKPAAPKRQEQPTIDTTAEPVDEQTDETVMTTADEITALLAELCDGDYATMNKMLAEVSKFPGKNGDVWIKSIEDLQGVSEGWQAKTLQKLKAKMNIK